MLVQRLDKRQVDQSTDDNQDGLPHGALPAANQKSGKDGGSTPGHKNAVADRHEARRHYDVGQHNVNERAQDERDEQNRIQHDRQAKDNGLVDVKDAGGDAKAGEFLQALGFAGNQDGNQQRQGAATAANSGEQGLELRVNDIRCRQSCLQRLKVFSRKRQKDRIVNGIGDIGSMDTEEPQHVSE